MSRYLLGLLLMACALPASAVDVRAFSASYEVLIDGKPQGRSNVTLVEESPGVWRHLMQAEGTRGLARLSGYGMRQDSRFRLVQGRPQLQSAESRSEVLVRSRTIRTLFDWDAGVARWEGDVKPDQRGPIALSPDAANGALLNMLLALDVSQARAGTELRYRLLERGDADELRYVVGGREAIEVPAGRYQAVAVRGERPEKQRVTTAWYAADLPPTPVRMLQVEAGKSSYELRLASLDP